MTHMWLMFACAGICLLDAGIWLCQGAYADTLCFGAFGIGYIGLGLVLGGYQ